MAANSYQNCVMLSYPIIQFLINKCAHFQPVQKYGRGSVGLDKAGLHSVIDKDCWMNSELDVNLMGCRDFALSYLPGISPDPSVGGGGIGRPWKHHGTLGTLSSKQHPLAFSHSSLCIPIYPQSLRSSGRMPRHLPSMELQWNLWITSRCVTVWHPFH